MEKIYRVSHLTVILDPEIYRSPIEFSHPIKTHIEHNSGVLTTNEKIAFYLHDTTPWLNLDIHRDFSVGGGWGLGWANRERTD